MDQEDVRTIVLQALNASLDLQLRAVRQLLGEEEISLTRQRGRGRRRQSLVDLSVRLLTESRRPMHVNEIVEALRTKHGRVTDRDSISSALGKKARQGVLVRQCAPATFQYIDEQ